jgi:hypothetical protein
LYRAAPPLTALLLAVAVLFAALWFRGRTVSDTLRVSAGGGYTVHAFSGQGSAALLLTRGGDYFARDNDRPQWWAYAAATPPIDFRTRWANLGDETRFADYGFVVIRGPQRGTVLGVLGPGLPMAAGLAGIALVRLAYWRLWARRRGRIVAGLCPDCAHDMRGLAERCPGCGRPRVRGGFRIGRVRGDAPARRAA